MNRQMMEKHIGVLDGIRAIAMIFVVWYHFWQQSWITPPGVLAILVRYGFSFVDLLILLSAVCNFYPYACAIFLGEPFPDTREFYCKRLIRILPSYYLCILVMFVYALLTHSYQSSAFLWRDLLSHLTFTSIFRADTLIGTRLNPVLWTVQIELFYYLLLPHLAKAFRRSPVLTCAFLWLISFASGSYILHYHSENIRFLVNNPLSFAGCYANGMLLCMIYLTLRQSLPDNRYLRLGFSLLGAALCFRLVDILKALGQGELQINQLRSRPTLSLAFTGLILAVLFTFPLLQKLFDNRIMGAISLISYNLYIWHQVTAVWFKKVRLPYWRGDTPPNITGDRVWMWQYQILILTSSLLIAILVTYAFEQPLTRLLRNRLKDRCTR